MSDIPPIDVPVNFDLNEEGFRAQLAEIERIIFEFGNAPRELLGAVEAGNIDQARVKLEEISQAYSDMTEKRLLAGEQINTQIGREIESATELVNTVDRLKASQDEATRATLDASRLQADQNEAALRAKRELITLTEQQLRVEQSLRDQGVDPTSATIREQTGLPPLPAGALPGGLTESQVGSTLSRLLRTEGGLNLVDLNNPAIRTELFSQFGQQIPAGFRPGDPAFPTNLPPGISQSSSLQQAIQELTQVIRQQATATTTGGIPPPPTPDDLVFATDDPDEPIPPDAPYGRRAAGRPRGSGFQVVARRALYRFGGAALAIRALDTLVADIDRLVAENVDQINESLSKLGQGITEGLSEIAVETTREIARERFQEDLSLGGFIAGAGRTAAGAVPVVGPQVVRIAEGVRPALENLGLRDPEPTLAEAVRAIEAAGDGSIFLGGRTPEALERNLAISEATLETAQRRLQILEEERAEAAERERTFGGPLGSAEQFIRGLSAPALGLGVGLGAGVGTGSGGVISGLLAGSFLGEGPDEADRIRAEIDELRQAQADAARITLDQIAASGGVPGISADIDVSAQQQRDQARVRTQIEDDLTQFSTAETVVRNLRDSIDAFGVGTESLIQFVTILEELVSERIPLGDPQFAEDLAADLARSGEQEIEREALRLKIIEDFKTFQDDLTVVQRNIGDASERAGLNQAEFNQMLREGKAEADAYFRSIRDAEGAVAGLDGVIRDNVETLNSQEGALAEVRAEFEEIADRFEQGIAVAFDIDTENGINDVEDAKRNIEELLEDTTKEIILVEERLQAGIRLQELGFDPLAGIVFAGLGDGLVDDILYGEGKTSEEQIAELDLASQAIETMYRAMGRELPETDAERFFANIGRVTEEEGQRGLTLADLGSIGGGAVIDTLPSGFLDAQAGNFLAALNNSMAAAVEGGETGEILAGSVSDAVAAIPDLFGEGEEIGLDLAAGMVSGMEEGEDGVENAAQRLALLIPATVRLGMIIESPSVVMREIGEDVIAGLIQGLEGEELEERVNEITNLIRSVGDEIQSAISSGFSGPTTDEEGIFTSGLVNTSLNIRQAIAEIGDPLEDLKLRQAALNRIDQFGDFGALRERILSGEAQPLLEELVNNPNAALIANLNRELEIFDARAEAFSEFEFDINVNDDQLQDLISTLETDLPRAIEILVTANTPTVSSDAEWGFTGWRPGEGHLIRMGESWRGPETVIGGYHPAENIVKALQDVDAYTKVRDHIMATMSAPDVHVETPLHPEVRRLMVALERGMGRGQLDGVLDQLDELNDNLVAQARRR